MPPRGVAAATAAAGLVLPVRGRRGVERGVVVDLAVTVAVLWLVSVLHWVRLLVLFMKPVQLVPLVDVSVMDFLKILMDALVQECEDKHSLQV